MISYSLKVLWSVVLGTAMFVGLVSGSLGIYSVSTGETVSIVNIIEVLTQPGTTVNLTQPSPEQLILPVAPPITVNVSPPEIRPIIINVAAPEIPAITIPEITVMMDPELERELLEAVRKFNTQPPTVTLCKYEAPWLLCREQSP